MDKAEWLKKRKEMITASDVASILGFGAHKTALDVYVEKVMGTEMEDNDLLLMGRALEDGIAKIYEIKTGNKIVAGGYDILLDFVRPDMPWWGGKEIVSGDKDDILFFVHPDIPWLGATPDRIVRREGVGSIFFDLYPEMSSIGKIDSIDDCNGIIEGPLECKHVGFYKRAEWQDGPPDWVVIQNQIQQACMDAKWGAFCGVVGGSEIHYGDIEFKSDFMEAAYPVLDEFHQRIKRKDPPPVENHRHLKAMKALHPLDNGVTVKLEDSFTALANELEQAKEDIKELAEKKDELEAKLREAIGDNTFAVLSDKSILSLKTTENKGYEKKVKPFTYRTLRRKRK
jgi:predicted phage-related endonuclease